jgi:ABC-type sugar transport system ATPase subunit
MPKKVYHYPETLFVADFIGSPQINTLPCSTEISDGKVWIKTDPGDRLETIYSPDDIVGKEKVLAAIRPEKLSFAGSPGSNTLKVRSRTVLPAGAETVIHTGYGNGECEFFYKRKWNSNKEKTCI